MGEWEQEQQPALPGDSTLCWLISGETPSIVGCIPSVTLLEHEVLQARLTIPKITGHSLVLEADNRRTAICSHVIELNKLSCRD